MIQTVTLQRKHPAEFDRMHRVVLIGKPEKMNLKKMFMLPRNENITDQCGR